MQGMNRNTGQPLSGIDHLRQSIIDILTTPVGSRVMRRDYGSRLYELVDAPMNRATLVDIYAATAEALLKWEPRLVLKRVRVSEITVGKATLFLEADYLPTGKTMTLENIIV